MATYNLCKTFHLTRSHRSRQPQTHESKMTVQEGGLQLCLYWLKVNNVVAYLVLSYTLALGFHHLQICELALTACHIQMVA